MFRFKQFTILQDRCAMKVSEMACLLGAWAASKESEAKQILDIGSGTGVLSLMLAQKCKHANLFGIDIDKEAVAQAEENACTASFEHGLTFLHGDIRAIALAPSFDCIICNPPFFENQLKSTSDKKNVAWHADTLPLQDLLEIVEKKLVPTGTFYTLLPVYREKEVKALAKDRCLQLYEKVDIKHSCEHEAKLMLCSFGRETNAAKESTLILKENGCYTAEVHALLSDYYLYL